MSEKKQATEKKDVKAQAATAKEARKEVAAKPAATEKAKTETKAPEPVQPTTKAVSIYALTEKAKTEFEKMKGQRKLMVAAFQKAGKPVGAHQLAPFFDDINVLTKQNPQAVIDYHCLKMLDDGYLVETATETIEVPKRVRKAKEAAPVAEAPVETGNAAQA